MIPGSECDVRLHRQVLSLHELPSAVPSLGWLADPHKQLPPLPEDGLPPTIDEGLQVRRRPVCCMTAIMRIVPSLHTDTQR